MMYWEDGHMHAGWGVAMMLGMLVFWVLIALVIGWFVHSTRTARPPGATQAGKGAVTAAAEQILAERLARGEIEPEEYQTRLRALQH